MIFRLALEWHDVEAYYQGRMPRIAVRAEDGRRVVFPTSALRPFLSQSGVHGRFEMRYRSDDDKLIELRRLA